MIRVFRDQATNCTTSTSIGPTKLRNPESAAEMFRVFFAELVPAVQHDPLSMPGDEAFQVLRGAPPSDGLL